MGCGQRIVVLAVVGAACNSSTAFVGDGGHSGSGGAGESGDSDDGPPIVDCIDRPDDGSMFGPGEPGPLGLFNARCNPRGDESDGPYHCCSDDPAAAHGQLPDYVGRGIDGGEPIFSGRNNDVGTRGACVRVDQVGNGLVEAEAAGCPVPCNPTWAEADVVTVCGTGRTCCQTAELEPKDCIVVDGESRPVTGADIDEHTRWSQTSHETHQDPNGTGCLAFAGGDIDSDAFFDCVEQLTVADQRGFCMPAGSCPVEPGYVDACTAAGG